MICQFEFNRHRTTRPRNSALPTPIFRAFWETALVTEDRDDGALPPHSVRHGFDGDVVQPYGVNAPSR